MGEYNTEQRRVLLKYLEDNHDMQFTAKQIATSLSENGISISAIYRNLSSLEKEGIISRFSVNGSRETYYRYTDIDCCRDKVHLICTKCGQTTHLDINTANNLEKKVSEKDGFTIDTKRTVLYGICKNCR